MGRRERVSPAALRARRARDSATAPKARTPSAEAARGSITVVMAVTHPPFPSRKFRPRGASSKRVAQVRQEGRRPLRPRPTLERSRRAGPSASATACFGSSGNGVPAKRIEQRSTLEGPASTVEKRIRAARSSSCCSRSAAAAGVSQLARNDVEPPSRQPICRRVRPARPRD